MQTSYKRAGVDIDAGDKLVDQISPFAAATKRLGTNSKLGGFGALFDLKQLKYRDPILVSSTDGVGTKLKLAFAANYHDTIGIDLVAMSVNDILVSGAEPLFFLDYFACGKLEVGTAASVIKGIAAGCKQAGCALIGGETAEMPGMYQAGEYDLAGFAVGAVERSKMLPKNVRAGDVIIGLPSSGVHSNGYSLVRFILAENKIALSAKIDDSKKSLKEILLAPTKIYVKPVLAALKTSKIKALAHITGGGLVENTPRVLGKKLKAEINYGSWEVPPIFNYLQKLGRVNDSEMQRTFNLGIGMVVITAKKDAEEMIALFAKHKEKARVIGVVSS